MTLLGGSTGSGLLPLIASNLSEGTDSEAMTRMTSWVNQVASKIQREAGIRGLQVEGYADFAEGILNMPLNISTAHNLKSTVTRVEKAWLEEYEYDTDTSAWVTTGNRYDLEEIAYSDYIARMNGSDSTGTPTYYALALPTDRSTTGVTFDINAYLYPPPDSEDTTDSTGKKWRFRFFGEASIGELSAETDVVYPVGADDIFITGVMAQQCVFDKDYQGAHILRADFRNALDRFLAREHAHKTMYVFGRVDQTEADSFEVETPLTVPG